MTAPSPSSSCLFSMFRPLRTLLFGASRFAGRASELLLAAVCSAIAVVLCLQAVSRYAFNYSLSWPDELSQVLLVWLTFLGGAVVWRQGSHLAVGMLTEVAADRLGAWWARAVQRLTLALGMLFFIILIFYGGLLCRMLWPQLYPSLGVSKVVSYAAIPVGAGLLLLHSLAQWVAPRAVAEGRRAGDQ